MTDFTSEADIISGFIKAEVSLLGCSKSVYKTSLTSAAGFYYGTWMAAGEPIAMTAPGTTWSVPTSASPGAWNKGMVNAGVSFTNRLIYAGLRPANAGTNLRIIDLLGWNTGLSGTSTSAQTVNGTLTAPAASYRCDPNGLDARWFLHWITATGSTAVTATVAVTYNDDTTGTIAVALPASVPAYRLYPIIPTNGKSIKSVQTVTLSATTGTAGSFGVCAVKYLSWVRSNTANNLEDYDWSRTKMPRVGDDACITGMMDAAVATTTGIFSLDFVVGGA